MQCTMTEVKFRHRYHAASSSVISVITLLNVYNFSPLAAACGGGGGGGGGGFDWLCPHQRHNQTYALEHRDE